MVSTIGQHMCTERMRLFLGLEGRSCYQKAQPFGALAVKGTLEALLYICSLLLKSTLDSVKALHLEQQMMVFGICFAFILVR